MWNVLDNSDFKKDLEKGLVAFKDIISGRHDSCENLEENINKLKGLVDGLNRTEDNEVLSCAVSCNVWGIEYDINLFVMVSDYPKY